MKGYFGDVVTLAVKDLRLELRARDTLPAVALFVLSTMTIFHFALPSGSSDAAADKENEYDWRGWIAC